MKQKKVFELPFIGISEMEGYDIVYSNDGNYSVVMEIQNMALQYAANPETYGEYHNLFGQLIKILGEGFIIQKTDIIAQKEFKQKNPKEDYLSQKYFEHFNGRTYNELTTYLTVTKENNKNRFFTYDAKEIKDFVLKINKITDTFSNQKVSCTVLPKKAINNLFSRFQAYNFRDEQFSIGNIACDEQGVYFGDKSLKAVSLIDIDELNIPNSISTYAVKNEIGKNFPIDNFSFLLSVPDCETVLYNQVVFIPEQIKLKRELELKKKRHSSMPDPANKVSVDDIEDMFLSIAQDNELLVYSHFSIFLFGDNSKIEKAINYVDTHLFAIGIIPGKNTYNQMELYRASICGNASELKKYDKFLTSRPAAICFFFKESLPKSENSDYLLYFTDRQGIPIGIDTSELPMQTNRISNRNRFILGPSGSGKSFFTNSYAKQCRELGADIVLVDTGHSYQGLCRYFNGKYITYREDKPITMNPFKIEEIENNEEKRQILVSLVGLIWKGVDGKLNQVEDSILSKCIADYYRDYFSNDGIISELKFDTFYDFSCSLIEKIVAAERVKHFDLDEYRFILKKFYKDGIYEKILNDDFDDTLFNEPFIVFEIDSIKEHKLLFPITTLIIMDVFIQKMRYKKNKKVLIIEEAWKAIASPMMAGYILYLYKTVRKFLGEAIVVTQELGDIIGNAIVKDSIISNSDTICLLDQSKFKDNFHEIAKLLSINEVEQNKIFTINKLDNKENRSRFKEVYIKRGATGEVYGVEVPIEEYLTYTTERPEKEALEVYLTYYENYKSALDNFINDLKESGWPLPAFVKHINKTNTIYTIKSIAV
jgi:conjugation system TraG family ATPase